MSAAPSIDSSPNLARLRDFVVALTDLVGDVHDEPALLREGAALLRNLVSHDDWLHDDYAAADPERYRQYLLYCDGRERFSVVSFVWGPGQGTPVHDHRVWGLVGVLRGAERNQRFVRDARGALVPSGSADRLGPGSVTAVSKTVGDIHRVENAYDDRPSISIHVYGGNIGAVERATYDAAGNPKRFVSGYWNKAIPNLWDRSSAR